eukprot:SAG31_NODE_23250_length_508_cov_0.623472_1_plen_29_part_10
MTCDARLTGFIGSSRSLSYSVGMNRFVIV